MKILVSGGAGYIGSHAVYELINQGYKVVIVDNLSNGHKKAVHPNAYFYNIDIRNKICLKKVFENHTIDGVMHFAASSVVNDSTKKPLEYFNNNIHGTQVLLEIMKEFDTRYIVFSSTASVYGETHENLVTETSLTNPSSPYGESKLIVEKILDWCDNCHGIKFVSLRYFNVAGARNDAIIGEDHHPETHLIPTILNVALGKTPKLEIFGNDFDTKDGSCIRDYIHVEDLIQAHILSLKYLITKNKSNIFNLGNTHGYSVKEILNIARKITGKNILAVIKSKRNGDPKILVADSTKAKKLLNWQPKYTDINKIISTAWNWHKKNPYGYKE